MARSISEATSAPDVQKCFNCHPVPAVCKGLCRRAQKSGWIYFCERCYQDRRCPICKGSGSHQIDEADFQWTTGSVQILSRKSPSTEVETTSVSVRGDGNVTEAAPVPQAPAAPSWNGTPSPRSYQWEAFRQVCEGNTIVNMETGLGKTLVAVMSIDHFIRQQADKKVLVCVPTIALANQQAEVIQKQSTVPDLRVASVTGKITKQTQEWWQHLKDEHQVLVGIGAIFQQALLAQAFLRLSELSLIVLDECHYAKGSHPFVSIMQDPEEWRNRHTPRVLGLTASFLNGRTADLLGERKKLEENLRSQIWCPKEEDIKDFRIERSYTTVSYQNDKAELQELQEECRKSLEKVIQAYSSQEGSPLWDCREDLEKQQALAQRCFKEAGLYGWRAFLKIKLLPAIRSRLDQRKHDPYELIQAEENWDLLRASQPEKLQQLLLLLEDLFRSENPEQRCIVFVEQVDDTYPLSQSIDQHMKRRMTRYFMGSKNMSETKQKQALQDFRDGSAPILVATAAVEEGLDVASCSAVFRYHSFHTTKSHIQGAGRARQMDARIFYFENDWKEEEIQAETMRQAARAEIARPPEPVAAPEYPMFLHPNTDAQVDAYNCLAILHEYASKVTRGQWKDRLFIREEGIIVACCVPVPVGTRIGEIRITEDEVAIYWKQVARSEGEPHIHDFVQLLDQDRLKRWNMDVTLQHRFAMVAVRRLSKEGHIDDRNMPSEQAMLGQWVEETIRPEEEAVLAKLLNGRAALDQGWSNGTSAHIATPQEVFAEQGWSNGTSAHISTPQEVFGEQGWSNGTSAPIATTQEVFGEQGWSNGTSAHIATTQEVFGEQDWTNGAHFGHAFDQGWSNLETFHDPGRSRRAFRARTQSPSGRAFDGWSQAAPRASTPPPSYESWSNLEAMHAQPRRRRSPSRSRNPWEDPLQWQDPWDQRSNWEDRSGADRSSWQDWQRGNGWQKPNARYPEGWQKGYWKNNPWEDRDHWREMGRGDARDRRYERDGGRRERHGDPWEKWKRNDADTDWRSEWRGLIDTSRWQGRSSLDLPEPRRGRAAPSERLQETVPARNKDQAPPAPAKLRDAGSDTGKSGKMRLNEFLQKYCGNVPKAVDYETVPAPGAKLSATGASLWVSTLRLQNLGGRPGEGMAFSGEAKVTRQDAEHSASDAALRYFATLPGAPAVTAPPEPSVAPPVDDPIAAAPPVEKIDNPKGSLQEMVLKKMRRQTAADFCYEVLPVATGFIVQLRLGAHVVGGEEPMSVDSRPFAVKTKKCVKEAEEEVATKALLQLRAAKPAAAPLAPLALTQEPHREAEAPPLPPLGGLMEQVAPVPVAPQAPSSDGVPPAEQEGEKVGDESEKVEETVKVCLVRPDGKEKCMILLNDMSIADLIEKYRPSSLGQEEVEVVGPGDMVLLPEFTLADCTLVFDTQEEVPKFFFRKAED